MLNIFQQYFFLKLSLQYVAHNKRHSYSPFTSCISLTKTPYYHFSKDIKTISHKLGQTHKEISFISLFLGDLFLRYFSCPYHGLFCYIHIQVLFCCWYGWSISYWRLYIIFMIYKLYWCVVWICIPCKLWWKQISTSWKTNIIQLEFSLEFYEIVTFMHKCISICTLTSAFILSEYEYRMKRTPWDVTHITIPLE